MNADRLRHLNDRLLISGNDCSDVLLDAALEIERLRAENENERLLDHIRQMMNVPEFARNSMKDQCIAELEAEREALRAENERLTLDTTWQDHADHWQKRAMEAEARVAELKAENERLREACEAALSDDQPYIEKCRAALAKEGE